MKHRKIKSEIAFYLQNFDQIEYMNMLIGKQGIFAEKLKKKV